MRYQYLYIIIFLFSLFPTIVKAQKTSVLGRFEVDNDTGCAPFTVTVSSNLTGTIDQYKFEQETPTQEETHTFSTPGIYWIRQYSNLNNFIDSVRVEVKGSPEPDIFIYKCESNKIKLELKTSNVYNAFAIDFGDGNNVTTPSGSIEHTYPLSTSYILTVKGLVDPTSGINSNPNTSCQVKTEGITTINGLQKADLTELVTMNSATDAGKISLKYTANSNITYKLETSENSSDNFIFNSYISNYSTLTLDSLNTFDNNYCVRLTAYDACSNTEIPSDTLCSINLKISKPNKNHQLSWETSSETNGNFSLDRNGEVTYTGGENSYLDTILQCGVQYCYIVQEAGLSGVSKSNSVCSLSEKSYFTVPVEDVSVSVNGENTEISWQIPSSILVKGFEVMKGRNDDYTSLGQVNTTSFTERLSGSSCYKIRYYDNCDNPSPLSKESCVVFPEGSSRPNLTNRLLWNEYGGWLKGVDHYEVEIYNSSGELQSVVDTGISTNFLDDLTDNEDQVNRYRIKAVPVDATIPFIYSPFVEIKYPVQVFIPEAFTPQGDNLNDFFTVKGRFIKEMNMKIFNSWGEMIFFSDNIEIGWDGEYKGKEAPQGMYAYKISGLDDSNGSFSKSGYFLLIRKK